MIGLFRSELLRARSRRIVPMVLVGGVILIVVAMVIAGANSHKPTEAQIGAAQAFAQKQFARCMNGQYLGRGGQLPSGFASLEEFCTVAAAPVVDTGLQFRDVDLVIQHTGTFTVLLGIVLGASLMGADWSAGTMTTLLTWEPRRTRVLLIRALVAALVVALVTLTLQAILLGAFSLAVALRGTSAGAPPGGLSDAVQTALRVSTVAVGFGLVALAVATIGRSTVAGLGVLFGYLVLFEGVIAGFRPSIQDRLLVRAGSVIVSQQPIYDESHSFSSIGPSNLPPVLLGLTEAWVVGAIYVLVLMVLALLVFRARDVN